MGYGRSGAREVGAGDEISFTRGAIPSSPLSRSRRTAAGGERSASTARAKKVSLPCRSERSSQCRARWQAGDVAARRSRIGGRSNGFARAEARSACRSRPEARQRNRKAEASLRPFESVLEPLTGVARFDDLATLGAVKQFDQCHRGIVALTEAELEDPQIAAVAVREARAKLVESLTTMSRSRSRLKARRRLERLGFCRA